MKQQTNGLPDAQYQNPLSARSTFCPLAFYSTHFRRSARITCGVALVITLLCSFSAQAAGLNGNHFSVYAQTVDAAFPPNFPPLIGEQIVFARDVYQADLSDPANPVPVGDVIGSNITVCIAAPPAGISCSGSLTLFGRGSLMLQAPFVFENPTNVAVTGGTGDFAGVGGTASGLELNLAADQLFEFSLSRGKSE